MTPRQYWDAYVQKHGGAAKVANRLDIAFPTIAAVCNGSRGIGKNLAIRMAEADPDLDHQILVWVRPERDEQGRAADAA